MSRPAILDAFASHAFLNRLNDRCLMELAAGAVPFAASAGHLARKGDVARAFYLIQSGAVEVGTDGPDGDFQLLWSVGPGGVIGWSWLVPPHRWNFSCKADGPVQGLMFDAQWLRDKCEENHELGYHLLKEMVASITAPFAASHGIGEPAAAEEQFVAE